MNRNINLSTQRARAAACRSAVACALLLSFVARAPAAPLPVAAPAAVGMSAERLAHLDAAVAQSIERRETPGAVVLAARKVAARGR